MQWPRPARVLEGRLNAHQSARFKGYHDQVYIMLESLMSAVERSKGWLAGVRAWISMLVLTPDRRRRRA